MKNWLKKACAIMVAFTLLLGLTTVPAHVHADTALFTIEGENAQLSSDLQVATSIYGTPKPGYSGTGFVWMQNSGTITFTVTVPETGMYAISTRYMQELSPDGRLQYLSVNGVNKGSYMLPYTTTWSDYNFGFHKLTQGTNTIELKAGWGFAYFDTFTVDYADLDPLDVQPVLTDSQATPETQLLMNYLTEVYGDHIISGQQEIYGGGNNGNTELEFDWIHNLTGEYPAIRGFDLMNYNPLYGWEDGTTSRMIDWVNNRGGIATTSWHITVPKNFTAYQLGQAVDWKEATYKPTETDFNTANAVVPGTKEYQYVKMAIADLAEQLQILQNNGVPVIFRPYHEAEGNGGLNGEGAWFWWAKAGAAVYKQLWDMLYTDLTETYGLHNLIWTYNSYTYSTSPAWYPGDDQVDLVGYDKYNTIYNRYDGLSGVPNEDAITSTFYQLVDLTDGTKMVAMTENDTVPSLQNLTEEKSGWLYFCPWYGEFLMSTAYNYPATLTTLYQSNYVITLDELPNLKVNTPSASITPTSASFDKKTSAQADIDVTMTLNGNTLSGIKNGSASLVSGTDYTVSGTTVTIKKSYLAAQAVGTTNLTFDFSAGTDRVLAVSIVDTTVALPGALTLTGTAGNAQASLSWTASTGATSYKVQRATTSTGTYTDLASNLTALSYVDTTAANGTSYYYRVVATNTAGSTTSNTVSVTPAAPVSVPGAFTLTGTAGNAQASLSWTASSGAATYNVERATGSGSYTALATGLTVLTYTDTTAANGTTYNYRIVAVNAAGTTNSNAVSLTPAAPASVPGAFTLTGTAGNAQASLSWTASTGAATYNVERATGSGSYTALATGLTGLTYTDTTAANGTLYNYRIVAVNTVGTTNSNVVSLTPTAPATTSGLVVQYKTSNNNATDNQIYATFNIKNTGTSAVSLSNLKLRYYLTKDTTSATLNYWVDYAQVGGSSITGAFTTLSPAKTNADTYLELSFSSAAGSIAAGGQSGEIQVRIAKSDWSNFNEANDHSFDGTKTAFADWNKVTLYQSGTLVWGVEPQ